MPPRLKRVKKVAKPVKEIKINFKVKKIEQESQYREGETVYEKFKKKISHPSPKVKRTALKMVTKEIDQISAENIKKITDEAFLIMSSKNDLQTVLSASDCVSECAKYILSDPLEIEKWLMHLSVYAGSIDETMRALGLKIAYVFVSTVENPGMYVEYIASDILDFFENNQERTKEDKFALKFLETCLQVKAEPIVCPWDAKINVLSGRVCVGSKQRYWTRNRESIHDIKERVQNFRRTLIFS